MWFFFFFFQAEDGIRDLVRSRGLGDVYKRQAYRPVLARNERGVMQPTGQYQCVQCKLQFTDIREWREGSGTGPTLLLSLIHI